MFNKFKINSLISYSKIKDFLSINSFWINIYDRIDKFLAIDYEIIFSYCVIISTEYLKDLMESFEVFELKEKLNQIMFNTNHINKVNSFFQSDKFKGIVVDVNASAEIRHEVFLTPVKSKYLTRINKGSNNGSLFLNSLMHLEVSTNYDFKEQKLANYAAIIKQDSNPVLLMQIDPLPNDIDLKINWINPNSNL